MIRKDKDFTKVDTHTYTQESKEEREKKYSGIWGGHAEKQTVEMFNLMQHINDVKLQIVFLKVMFKIFHFIFLLPYLFNENWFYSNFSKCCHGKHWFF